MYTNNAVTVEVVLYPVKPILSLLITLILLSLLWTGLMPTAQGPALAVSWAHYQLIMRTCCADRGVVLDVVMMLYSLRIGIMAKDLKLWAKGASRGPTVTVLLWWAMKRAAYRSKKRLGFKKVRQANRMSQLPMDWERNTGQAPCSRWCRPRLGCCQ